MTVCPGQQCRLADIGSHDWARFTRLPCLVLLSHRSRQGKLTPAQVQRFVGVLSRLAIGPPQRSVSHVAEAVLHDLSELLQEVGGLSDASALTASRQTVAAAIRVFDADDCRHFLGAMVQLHADLGAVATGHGMTLRVLSGLGIASPNRLSAAIVGVLTDALAETGPPHATLPRAA